MGIFAPIGTVYPSLSAFKLDSFERGFQHGLNLTTRTASPNVDQHTYCQIKVGSEKKYCSFRTVAKNVAGVIQVTQVVEEHMCPAELRKTNEGLAKEIMKDKIEKLRREIEKGGGQVVTTRETRPSKSEDVTSEPEEEIGSQESEEESEFEDGGSEDEMEGRSATSPPKRKKRRTRTTTDTSASKLQAAVLFPKAQDLFREIALLKQSGIVSLPAPNRTFASARELLVVLHAHSQQRGFTIYRNSSHAQITELKMVCTRHSSRYLSKPGGPCRYELHAKQNVQTGEWRFIGTKGSHNHALKALQGDTAATAHAVTSSQQIRTSSPSSLLPSPSFSPFALSSLPPNTASDRYTSHPDPQFSLSPAPVVARLKPLSSYPSDLVSFVRSFDSPPPALTNTLAVLDQVGISSVDVLVLILLTDEATLEQVKKSVGENVGKKLEEMAAEVKKEVGSKE